MANPNEARKTICSKAWAVNLRRMLALLAVTLWHTGLASPHEASEGLATEPVLRIETGLHDAQIRRIDTDGKNRFAVTASIDKTVRLWSLPDGKLLRIFRLPIGPGNTGKGEGVAISPDGSKIAAGSHPGTIFLFDRASGELIKHLGLPDTPFHLVYSPDGRLLAASLGSGIRVFDAGHDYQPLPSDTQYKEPSYGATFDRTGRLVTVSYDGYVRLCAANDYAHAIKAFNFKGHRPYSAAFSPDGARVAVGFEDSSKVAVLSGSDLTELFEPDTSGIPDKGSLVAVGWSKDGRFLYAGGYYSWENGAHPIRRWSKGGKGAFIDLPAGFSMTMEIQALMSGSMLFARADGFGLISPDAKTTQLQGIGSLALNSGGGELLTSADGATVQVNSWEPQHAYRFVLGERRLNVDPPADTALLAPITQAPGLNITNFPSPEPAVNGAPIKLSYGESARSLAVVPGTQHFLLGAAWSVHLFDELGRELWPKPQAAPDAAGDVNVTPDRRLGIVAYGDGTIRWLRLSDGEELLALFIHPDGKRWVAWTPQGYYDASVGGDELIGWHVNHGYDRGARFLCRVALPRSVQPPRYCSARPQDA